MNFIKIGKHEWCTEDARFTQSQNGDSIPIAKTMAEWESYCLNDEYCCCAYDFDDRNIKKYGLLYNVHVVNQADSVVPVGTRLASYEDWCDLMNSLGSNIPKDKYSQSEMLIKLKSDKGWPGKIAFITPLIGSNDSGFTALPGGCINSDIINGTIFAEKGEGVSWWTSDYANPYISAHDKNKFGLYAPSNPDDFFDTKKSNFKKGRYIRLIRM